MFLKWPQLFPIFQTTPTPPKPMMGVGQMQQQIPTGQQQQGFIGKLWK